MPTLSTSVLTVHVCIVVFFNMCCMCRSPLIPAVLAKLRGCYLSLAIEPVTDIYVLHIQGHLFLMMGHLSDGTCSMDPFCPVPSSWLKDSVPVFLFQRCRLITQAESVSSLWSFPLWRFLQLRREQKSILISAHQINCTQNLNFRVNLDATEESWSE